MNFLSKLLQAIAFVPGLVNSIDGLFQRSSETGCHKLLLERSSASMPRSGRRPR